MSQNVTLSAKAKKIVDNFINKNHYNRKENSISRTDVMKHVIVTLYAQMPTAKAELIAPFKDCIFDLHEYFTQEEIDIILKETKGVIKYCYEFSDVMSHINFYEDSEITEDILCDDSPYTIYKTPKSVIELCMRLSGKPQKGDKVLIPYGDVADYTIYAPDAKYLINCEGFEEEGIIPNVVNAFYKILLDSQNVESKIVYNDCDPIDLTINQKIKDLDYVFAYNPTLNQSCNSSLHICDGMWNSPQHVTATNLAITILSCSLLSLKSGKSLDVIFPTEYLEDKDFWNAFKLLFENKTGKNDISSTLIYLPRMEFGDTFVNMFLLHIEKGKGNSGMIRFINATGSEFYNEGGYTEVGRKTIFDDIDKGMSYDITNPQHYQQAGINTDFLMEVINSEECNTKYEERLHYTKFFGENEHAANQYLINKKLPELTDGEEYIPLRDLVDVISANKIEEGRLPLIDTKLLHNNYTVCDILPKNISRHTLEKEPEYWSGYYPKYFTLSEDCIIAGLDTPEIKVGRLSNVEDTIAFKEGVTPFHIKSNLITEDYLLRELTQEYCSIQAKMLSEKYISDGDKIDILSPEFFLDINIAVPSLEEQERRCKEDTQKSLEEALKNLKESDRQLLLSAKEFNRDVHMKKHAIGQTLFNLKNWWDKIQKTRRDDNGVLNDSTKIDKAGKFSIEDAFANIQLSIEKLQKQVDSFWRADGFKAEIFDLSSFIENYIKKQQSPLFKYEFDVATDRSLNINFPEEALSIVFDNIINNACSHGFDEEFSEKNTIRLETRHENGQTIIIISNNGKPLHEKITGEDVFTYGRSSKNGQSHFGIGGYEIRYLMREFNGNAEFISSPTDEYTVSYKLAIKDSNKIDSTISNI